jgi:outer membrane lipoprotein-sorting protein
MSMKTLLASLSASFALMAGEPSGLDVLRQASETYSHMKTESIEATVVMDLRTHRVEIPIKGVITRPDKFYFEVVNAMMGSQTISDGHYTWKYVAAFQQYTKVLASPGSLPIAEGPREILTGENLLDHLQSAVLLPAEKLTVDGKEVLCDVVEATYEPDAAADPGSSTRKTFWVDAQRGVILKVASRIRMDSAETGGAREIPQTVTVHSIKINEPLRASLFAFIAPEGVREVAQLSPPRSETPVNQQRDPE